MNVNLSQVQKMLDWLKTKLYLDSNAVNSARRTVKRGQVYRCNFGCGVGSEMQKDRPAVIVQNDVGNNRSGNTIVVPITHDASTLPCVANITAQNDAAGNVIIDGQANTSNIMCISKARLGNYVCDLSNGDMKLIDEALAKTMELIHYYSDISGKLADKLSYIERIKADRNKAQDELSDIRTFLGISAEDPLLDHIKKLKEHIDK